MLDEDGELEARIRACVRSFYDHAKSDDLLGPVFCEHIRDWDRHLSTMDDFWSGALLGTDRYKGAPFPPHLKLSMDQRHFDRWRELWLVAAAAELPEPLRAKAAAMGEHMSHCWGKAHTVLSAPEPDVSGAPLI